MARELEQAGWDFLKAWATERCGDAGILAAPRPLGAGLRLESGLITTTKPAPAGCCRHRGIGQDTDNQVPDVETFAVHHGHELAASCTVSDSAWNNCSSPEYKTTQKNAPDDAHAGKFPVLVMWALDRIVREGAEDALRIFRPFRQRGYVVVSVRESWLCSAPEVQDVLIASAGWMAEREPARKSEQIKAGLATRAAQGKPVGRQPGCRAGR